jgi:hypothetical protein
MNDRGREENTNVASTCWFENRRPVDAMYMVCMLPTIPNTLVYYSLVDPVTDSK